MIPHAAGVVVLATGLAGCALIGDLPGRGLPPVTADLSVYNRTEEDIFLVAADGERLSVPACGDARDPSFRIDQVEVRTEAGYIRAFGMGDSFLEGRQLFLVEVASTFADGIPEERQVAPELPPCEGHPAVQPGA
ncbi:MAG TPA: hypothetical protein VGQ66_00355 [Candidatus Limnocylindria bacterium]|nr:hypothetical protein [Candidatus Limnocylindria bacterium]